MSASYKVQRSIEEDDHQIQPPFLRLPSLIRHQIYAEANILGSKSRFKFINLNHRGAPDRNHDRPSFLVTWNLLLTCRTLYGEVSSRIYADNYFFIRYNERRNLESLRSLLPTSMRAIRHLSIHLNVASCGISNGCDFYLNSWDLPVTRTDTLDTPLQASDPATQVSDAFIYLAY